MSDFDYDLIIIGAGVGGHGAALHAVKQGLKHPKAPDVLGQMVDAQLKSASTDVPGYMALF